MAHRLAVSAANLNVSSSMRPMMQLRAAMLGFAALTTNLQIRSNDQVQIRLNDLEEEYKS
jgi:hypothetical protein